MTPGSEQPVNVDDLLRTMDARLQACETVSQRSIALISQARDQCHRFRAEPLGGRLVGLKRLVYWFSASAFDRQTTVQEAILTAMDEIARELVDLRNRMVVVRVELERNAERSGDGGPSPNGWR
jgi:hypothetical protein